MTMREAFSFFVEIFWTFNSVAKKVSFALDCLIESKTKRLTQIEGIAEKIFEMIIEAKNRGN